MKPIIAITLRHGQTNDCPSQYAPVVNSKCVKDEGADCIFVGPDHEEAYYSYLAEICQGLLITGGRDIQPGLYRQQPHPETAIDSDAIDQMDFALIHAFHRRKKPILGICRGAQAVNVYFGGDLCQHIPDQPQFTCNHKDTDLRNKQVHTVTWTKEIPGLCKKDSVIHVNSLHHQGIDTLAPGFEVIAFSQDRLIEGIQKDNILAVQWHPEELLDMEDHRRIFEYFVNSLGPRE